MRLPRLAIRSLALATILAAGTFATTVFAVSPNSGATLQASKTIDICIQDDGSWKYSGEVSVWNTGAADAQGLHITVSGVN